MKQSKQALALVLSLLLLITALSACGSKKTESEPADSASPAESAEVPEAAADPGREAGERFEAVITIEGMEETIQLEHIRNESAGFEMDFDYESFVRFSDSDRECFVSVYDDPNDPQNYLEVAYCAENAEAVEAAVSAALSKDYAITRETLALDGAGSCVRIDASAAKDGSGTTDVLMDVYIIPAADGCRVATARHIAEGSDGFGIRLAYLVNTLTLMDARGERSMTDEQALTAVRRYCYISNPDLEGIVNDEEYTTFWEIASDSEDQIVVLFRSYTGAEVRYYIDPVSGDTYVTEFVSGITPDEQRTDESINMWEYLDWWRS